MTENARGTVVLVHGLCMHGIVFALHRRRMQRLGYRVLTFSYPSMRGRLDDIADSLMCRLAGMPDGSVNLVGHSLGGVIILAMLARHDCPDRIRRVLLLGSPCMGSRSAEGVARRPGLSWILGRALPDWLARSRCPALPYQIGVISGDRAIGMGHLLFGLDTPNDGIVSVDETCWPGACDRITLHVTHMQMLVSAECTRQIDTFLRTGHFDRSAQGDSPGSSESCTGSATGSG
ncbi:esterase/lipase family protein [Rhodocyclaceae bacterium SMB388]